MYQSLVLQCTRAVLFVISILFIIFFYTQPAEAAYNLPAVGVELDGYAWSSNIGWISMNCRTGDASGNDICAASDYKVTVNFDGTVSGYAWSSNIGWIKFGGLSSRPTGGGTTDANARVTGDYSGTLNFEGWARACAGTTSGDCSTMTSRSGGWDGWISLKGTATNGSPYAVAMTSAGGDSNAFAWGSTVVGWITFDPVTYVNNTVTFSLNMVPPGPCDIAEGASDCNKTLVWAINNGIAPYYLQKNTGGVVNISNADSGSVPITLTSLGATQFEIGHNNGVTLETLDIAVQCVSGTIWNGTSCVSNAIITPTVTLTTSRGIVRTGDTVTIGYQINPPLTTPGDSCALTGPGLAGPVTSSGTQTSAQLRSKTRFTVTCTGSFGTVTATTLVEVIPVAKEV